MAYYNQITDIKFGFEVIITILSLPYYLPHIYLSFVLFNISRNVLFYKSKSKYLKALIHWINNF